jgi:hypothetical protein
LQFHNAPGFGQHVVNVHAVLMGEQLAAVAFGFRFRQLGRDQQVILRVGGIVLFLVVVEAQAGSTRTTRRL